MERNDIARLRLMNQQLNGSAFRTPAKIVDYFGTIQAQSLTQAKWALSKRLPGSHHSEIDAALNERSIVRTWLFRANMSFVTPGDLPWILDFLAPWVKRAIQKRLEVVGLDPATLLSSHDIIFRSLKQNKLMTRDSLFSALEEQGIDTTAERGYLLLTTAALEKLIICGPDSVNAATFELYDDVVGAARSIPDEEALAELALRYFSSRGPALLSDFAWWAGLPLEEAKKGLKLVATQLTAVKSDNKLYFMPAHMDRPSGGDDIMLLPAFDEYLLSYVERSPVLDPRFSRDLMPKQNGIFLPMIVSRGEIIGTWTMEVQDEGLRLQTKAFRPFLEQEQLAIKEGAIHFIEFMSRKKEETDS